MFRFGYQMTNSTEYSFEDFLKIKISFDGGVDRVVATFYSRS